jgi:hypothetical protein
VGTVTGPASLALLIERLRWPVPRVRWETARQLALLIQSEDTAARQMLLSWNKYLELEADALLLPSIIYAFDLADHFSFEEVQAAISAPSILSDALVGKLYPQRAGRLFSFRLNYTKDSSLGGPPDPLFEGAMGSIIPPIFRSVLLREERRTGLPFVGRWRVEWQALRDRFREPYTRSPDFFFAGDRGATGSLDVRQRAVFVSAYLRTLAFAHLEWGMPQPYAVGLADLALPFNGTFARFEGSERPAWSQGFRHRLGQTRPANLARELWRDAASTIAPNFEPIALNVIDHDESLAVQITVQRVFAAGDGGVYEKRLDSPIWITTEGDPWSLSGQLPIGRQQTKQGLRPLCVAAHPEGFGRAHIEILAGHVLLADPLLAIGTPTITCEADRIMLSDSDGLLSTLHLWYADWAPVHPIGMNLQGSLTTCRSAALSALRRDCSIKTPRLAHIRVGRRAHSYEPFIFEDRTYLL